MRKLTVVENVTLDGVMQSPAAKDEDTRGGFDRGGWSTPYADEVQLREMSKGMGTTDLLFGRRTYEHFYAVWPNMPQPNPFTDVLNNSQKYVASTSLSSPLEWMNSTLLEGDTPEAVARLKEDEGKDIVVLGSGELVRSLIPHGLIDEYTLLIHPLVLGSGRRLFADDGSSEELTLDGTVTTTTGVVIATYHPSRLDG